MVQESQLYLDYLVIYVPSFGEAKIPKYALPLLDKSIITSNLLSAISACKAHYYYVKQDMDNL